MKHFLSDVGLLPKLPVVTLCLAAASLLLLWCGDLAQLLQYDRILIGDGQLWRIVTGHFVHWSFDHFLWCTITLIALGSVCEVISLRGYLAILAIASLVIPVLLWLFASELQFYRGLSGLASALFIYGAILLADNALSARDWPGFFLFTAAMVGYIGKILFECISGVPLFVENSELFSPVPLAHVVGGVIGLLVFFAVGGLSRCGAVQGS